MSFLEALEEFFRILSGQPKPQPIRIENEQDDPLAKLKRRED